MEQKSFIKIGPGQGRAFLILWVFFSIFWTLSYFLSGNAWLLIPTFLTMGPTLFLTFIFLYGKLWAERAHGPVNYRSFGSIDEL